MLSLRGVQRLSAILRRLYAVEAKTALSVDELRLTFASPTEVFFNNAVVKQVDVTTLNGAVGILPKHVPVLGMLKPGIVRVLDNEDKVVKYFASSGTLAMNPDGSCQVLAEEVVKLEEIDLQKAEEEMRTAQGRFAQAIDDSARAAVQVELETYEALVKAAQESDK